MPLVGFTLHADGDGLLTLRLAAHHLLLDGGGVALLERDLGAALGMLAGPDTPEASAPLTVHTPPATPPERRTPDEHPAPDEWPALPQHPAPGAPATAAPDLTALRAAHAQEQHRCRSAVEPGRRAVRAALEALPPHFGASTRPAQSRAAATAQGTQPHSADAAARGVIASEACVGGEDYARLVAWASAVGVPLDSTVTAAAAAITAAQSGNPSMSLLHSVDPRFVSPECAQATCLVNTVWFPLQFPAFVSARELTRLCDRNIVRSRRRLWLREEVLRREFVARPDALATAVTVNYLDAPVAPELAPHLRSTPTIHAIGPVEGPTLQAVHDAARSRLLLRIWEPARRACGVAAEASAGARSAGPGEPDATPRSPAGTPPPPGEEPPGSAGVDAARIAHYLRTSSRDEFSQAPAAFLAGAWSPLPGGLPATEVSRWTQLPGFDREGLLRTRPGVRTWLQRLEDAAIPEGSVVVLPENLSPQRPVDALLAIHLHGSGYAPCPAGTKQVQQTVRALSDAGETVALARRTVDGHVQLTVCSPAPEPRHRGGEGAPGHPSTGAPATAATAPDRHAAAGRPKAAGAGGSDTAYYLPTSGTTGAPKLVGISHANLAAFLDAARTRYGWGRQDVIGQCASLTSDISVEEVFLAALVGARSEPAPAGALAQPTELLDWARRAGVTVLDLPTSVWHAITSAPPLLDAVARSGLRQIVIGGEAVDPAAARRWCGHNPAVEVLSTYGPTEATVVATSVRIGAPGATPPLDTAPDTTAVGEPLIAGSATVAFGELLLHGPAVGPGYAGRDSDAFGWIALPGQPPQRVFATRDRVTAHPLYADDAPPTGVGPSWHFAGRWDELAKVFGQRVDLHQVRRIAAGVPGIVDAYAEVRDGRLTVWVQPAELRSVGRPAPGGDAAPAAVQDAVPATAPAAHSTSESTGEPTSDLATDLTAVTPDDPVMAARRALAGKGIPVSRVLATQRVSRDERGRVLEAVPLPTDSPGQNRGGGTQGLPGTASPQSTGSLQSAPAPQDRAGVTATGDAPAPPPSGEGPTQTHHEAPHGASPEDADLAAALAALWSRELGFAVPPEASLIDLAVPSLDLIRLLPGTRDLLGGDPSIRDLLSHPRALSLVTALRARKATTAGGQAHAGDTAPAVTHPAPARPAFGGPAFGGPAPGGPAPGGNRLPQSPPSTTPALPTGAHRRVALLGATGSVGSAVLRRWLDQADSKKGSHLVVVLRSTAPDAELWRRARNHPGVTLLERCGTWNAGDLAIADALGQHRVTEVLNCAGSVSTALGRAELDAVNVNLPAWLAECCEHLGAGLTHLSSTVVAERFERPVVTAAGQAHFDYAESKIAGERVLAGREHVRMVRLPRVLPTPGSGRSDALLSLLQVCARLGSYPLVDVTEDVVTAEQVAEELLRPDPGRDVSPHDASPHDEATTNAAPTDAASTATARPTRPGARLDVYRGREVHYPELLPRVAARGLPLAHWRQELDRSDLPRSHPATWGLMDQWARLAQVFQQRPWSTIETRTLPYRQVRSFPVGAQLSCADLLARAEIPGAGGPSRLGEGQGAPGARGLK